MRDGKDKGPMYIFILTTWFLIYMLNDDVKRYALLYFCTCDKPKCIKYIINKWGK